MGTNWRGVCLYVKTFMGTIRGIDTFLPLSDGSAHECTTDTRAEVIKVENRGILWLTVFS